MPSPVSSRPLRWRLPSAVLALLALLVGGLVVAAPAQAATAVSGTVTAGAGGTLTEAVVQAGTVSNGQFTEVSSVAPVTAADGSFTISGFAAPSRDYVLQIRSRDFRTAYFPMSGTAATTAIASAKSFTVDGADGPAVAAGSTTLTTLKTGTVSGVVKNAAGQPVPGVTVEFRADGAAPASAAAATATSANNGSYSVSLPANGTTYGFRAALADSGYAVTTGSGITVTDAMTTTRDVVLTTGSAFTGTVLRPDGADADTAPDPVQGVTITVESRTTTPSGTTYAERQVVRAVSKADGTFQAPVRPGDYVVGFAGGDLGTAFIRTRGTTTADAAVTAVKDEAALLTLPAPAAGSTTASLLDVGRAVLGRTGRVSGTVTTTTGVPISDVRVQLRQRQATADGGETIVSVLSTTTGADGTYTLPQVPPGTYKLFFNADAYADEYFPNSATFDGAGNVVVTAGGNLTGQDVQLAGNGAIVNLEKPWISGANQAGQTLTANPGVWAPAAVTFTYQWFADGQPIDGADERTYAISLFTSGARYAVEVTASAPERTSLTVRSAQTGPAGNLLQTPGFENRQVPMITGTPAVGETLMVSNGQWSSTPTAFAYQWFAAGTPVQGATSKTFVPTAAQLGQAITARVTATSGGASAASTSEATPVVARGRILNTALPTISGTPAVGSQLNATPGTWSIDGLTFTYQWLAAGTPVPGATLPTFTPSASEVGKRLAVRVVASRDGYAQSTATSAVTDAVADTTVVNTVRPTISGTAAVGQVLTASPGTWTPPTGVMFTYQWLADGAVLAGATATTFTPTAAQVGRRLSVRVTGSAPGRTPGTATSLETAPVSAGNQPPSVVGADVVGSPLLGRTLVVQRGTVTPSTTTTEVQWLRDGAEIRGATGTSYDVVAADLGRALAARVTYTSAGGATVRTLAAGVAKSVADVDVLARSTAAGTLSLRFAVLADAVDDLRGQVRVLQGRRELDRVTLLDGRGSVVLRGLRPGRQTLRLVYRPEVRTTGDRERVVVTVRG